MVFIIIKGRVINIYETIDTRIFFEKASESALFSFVRLIFTFLFQSC